MKTIEMTYTKRKQLDNVYQREGSLPPLEYTSKEDFNTILRCATTNFFIPASNITMSTMILLFNISSPTSQPLTYNFSNILSQ